RACPSGKEEALPQAAQQAHHHPVTHPAILLGVGAPPQIHAVEVVLTAHAASFLEQGGRPLTVRQFLCHKFTLATHTKITSFVRVQRRFFHFQYHSILLGKTQPCCAVSSY